MMGTNTSIVGEMIHRSCVESASIEDSRIKGDRTE